MYSIIHTTSQSITLALYPALICLSLGIQQNTALGRDTTAFTLSTGYHISMISTRSKLVVWMKANGELDSEIEWAEMEADPQEVPPFESSTLVVTPYQQTKCITSLLAFGQGFWTVRNLHFGARVL